MQLSPEQIASAQTPQQMAVSGANGTPTNQVVTPSSLETRQPVQPTTPTPIATPTVPDFLQVTQPEQQAIDQYSGISQSIAALTGQLAGRDAYTTGQQQQQDIIGKQSAIQNYQNQIKALQQEQQGISLQREQNIQAKQAAMSGQGIAAPIVARHSAIDTQYNQQTLTNAVKQYSIGAQLSAAQGDLTSALNYVDQAVKLKYQPIEAQLTAQQANLQAIQNSPNFTSAQKKQAAAQQLQLTQYVQQIADEKKAYQDTQDAIIKTVTNNPNITPQQNAALQAAKSPSEVAQLVNYFGLSSLSQQDALSMANTKQQMELAAKKSPYELAKLQAETAKAQAEAKTAVSGEAPVSPEVLQGMLSAYKATGVVPAFGLSAKNPLRAQFYAALGADGSIINEANANKVVRAGLNKAYSTQQNQYSANQTAISTLDKQLQLAQKYSNEVSRTDSPLVNRYLNSVQTGVFGDPETAALNNIVTTAAYEFSKILSGSAASIAGATVSSSEDAKNLLNSAMSKGQFNEVLALMQQESRFRLNSQKETLDTIKNDLGNIGTVTDTAKDVITTQTKIQDLRSKYNY